MDVWITPIPLGAQAIFFEFKEPKAVEMQMI
jgi:hypothetical protein